MRFIDIDRGLPERPSSSGTAVAIIACSLIPVFAVLGKCSGYRAGVIDAAKGEVRAVEVDGEWKVEHAK